MSIFCLPQGSFPGGTRIVIKDNNSLHYDRIQLKPQEIDFLSIVFSVTLRPVTKSEEIQAESF